MARKIKQAFLDELLTGRLNTILKYVREDDTLNLELRGKKITIYYRGGSILSIYQDTYSFEGLAKEYHQDNTFIIPSLDNFDYYIQKAKHAIDVYITTKINHLGEKDIQQQIARENNYSPNSLDTDYFIIDTEYQDLGRFDIVALRWDSTSSARKLFKTFIPTITIFEVKQGYNSISNKSGIEKHINDFNEFISKSDIDSFKMDMINVFNQKRSLGLIKGMDKYKEVNVVNPEIEFIFLLVNYKHDSTQLKKALQNIEDCKFIYSNPMGYGLFARNIISKDEFMNRFF